MGTAGNAHLERHAIAPGHAIVVFRDRHVADFTSLTTAEVAADRCDVHTVARMIERVFAPCQIQNYLLLGNTVPHLHVHLVPRDAQIILHPEGPYRGSPNLSTQSNSTGKSSVCRKPRRLDEMRLGCGYCRLPCRSKRICPVSFPLAWKSIRIKR